MDEPRRERGEERALGIDPALASGPLITTVNDLVAVVTYYGFARLLLSGLPGIG